MGIRQKVTAAILILMIATLAILYFVVAGSVAADVIVMVTIVLLSGFTAILVVVNTTIAHLVISPTAELECAMNLAKTGVFNTRIDIRTRDELGDLADSFNQLLNLLERNEYKNQALAKRLKNSFDEAKLQAHTDTLTELFNRRYLEKQLSIHICKSLADRSSLAVVFCDLDGFKKYNDEHGHQEGDEALKAVSMIIKASLRESDIAARYGGEEFALVLVQTDISGAKAVSERIRRAVENFAGKNEGEGPGLTISIGIAMLTSTSQTVNSLIRNADQAMYQAKHAGKNQLIVFGQTGLSRAALMPPGKLELKN